jgi:hypothetical protein
MLWYHDFLSSARIDVQVSTAFYSLLLEEEINYRLNPCQTLGALYACLKRFHHID